MKNKRGSLPMVSPNAAPLLKARVSGTRPPKSSMERSHRASNAHRLVAMSRITTVERMAGKTVAFILKWILGLRVRVGALAGQGGCR
jgi:hypothetical protein